MSLSLSPAYFTQPKHVQTVLSAFKWEVPGTAKINVRVVALALNLEFPGNAQINVTIALHITKSIYQTFSIL